MALADMMAELRGSVPKIPFSFTKTLINRAFRTIQDRNLWSFLLFEGQWIAPPILTGIGNATVVQGSNLVNLDATLTAAVNALGSAQPYSLITKRQFRIMPGGLYSIWGYNPTGAPGSLGQLTLDRWYGEGSTTTTSYSIYQAYYVPQVQNVAISDFKSWISVRDMLNYRDLFTERYTRRRIDDMDPQRSWFGIPTDVVPFASDQNPSSSTFGYFQYELWGHPTYTINYQLYGIRAGSNLVKPTDTLPSALGEDIVVALARYYAYDWAEANKGIAPRNVGPDFKFLMGGALKAYETLLKDARRVDRERVDNWFSIRRVSQAPFAFYSSQAGVANPGGFPW